MNEKIEKILKERIISKKPCLGNDEITKKILENIVTSYEHDSLNIFKEKLDSDEKIDCYLSWKNMLLGVIETEIKTDNYEYNHYVCCFLDDDLISINVIYILYDNELFDISGNEFSNDFNIKIEL
jgi:hypothetical protein